MIQDKIFVSIDNINQFEKLEKSFKTMELEYKNTLLSSDKFFFIDLNKRTVESISPSNFIKNYHYFVDLQIDFEYFDNFEQKLLNENQVQIKGLNDGYYIVFDGSLHLIEKFHKCNKTNTFYIDPPLHITNEVPMVLRTSKYRHFMFKVHNEIVDFTDYILLCDIIYERYAIVIVVESEVDKMLKYEFPTEIPFNINEA